MDTNLTTATAVPIELPQDAPIELAVLQVPPQEVAQIATLWLSLIAKAKEQTSEGNPLFERIDTTYELLEGVQCMDDESTFSLISLRKDTRVPVGFVTLSVKTNALVVDYLCSHPDRAFGGIKGSGSLLLKASETLALKLGLHCIEISNPYDCALPFYEKLNFSKIVGEPCDLSKEIEENIEIDISRLPAILPRNKPVFSMYRTLLKRCTNLFLDSETGSNFIDKMKLLFRNSEKSMQIAAWANESGEYEVAIALNVIDPKRIILEEAASSNTDFFPMKSLYLFVKEYAKRCNRILETSIANPEFLEAIAQ